MAFPGVLASMPVLVIPDSAFPLIPHVGFSEMIYTLLLIRAQERRIGSICFLRFCICKTSSGN